MKTQINTVVFVGSGNVATRLALALQQSGKIIMQVYGRSGKRAGILAKKLGVDFTDDLLTINREADLYVLSISDNALAEVVETLDLTSQFVVHTSGTSSMAVLNKFVNCGVLYPLQTFSKEKKISFKNIPLCIEANSLENLELLRQLALGISDKVQQIHSEQRRVLHVAAVFASNFTNYMYAVAEDILLDHNIPFDLLKPLIEETAAKLSAHSPHESQTGPARRNDRKTIEKHLEILKNYPEYQKIYQLISEQIKRKHH